MTSDARATQQVEIVTCCIDDVDCETDVAEADDRKMVSYIDCCSRYVDN